MIPTLFMVWESVVMLIPCGVGYCVSVVSLHIKDCDAFGFSLFTQGWFNESESLVPLF